VRWIALTWMLAGVVSIPVPAQTAPAPLVTQPIDDAKVVTLRGDVHPLAQPRYDVGPADESMPAGRLLLLLNRPADRETALADYMREVHNPASAAYHQWLTPMEFGARFGPAPSDILALSAWLRAKGLQVAGASQARTLLEFSGTVGQVNNAFHTRIRTYAVTDGVHRANATDPRIPEALAGLVRGMSALNDFHPRTNLRLVGQAHLDPSTGRVSPDDNLNGPDGPFYGVGPEDFATQYDLAPLYAAGIDGRGETIGIINDSNIDLNLDSNYRRLFKLPGGTAQVVLDGGDPGLTGDSLEAYLDVEMAGAVARGATVNLYLASWDTVPTALNDPLILAATRAIEDNQADVLSVSFGECEGEIGTADNQILNALWEQAAAQGQTVLVSAGDSGSAACDDPAQPRFEAEYGLAVNGFASTPWNIAVGGTDFYYADWASGAPSAAKLWNATNDASKGSLKARLPEQVWNDAYGFNAVNPDNTRNYLYNIVAGGGGASNCINSAASAQGSALPFVCSPVSGGTYGYPQPSWQSAPGVPANGVRNLPDVSLFAANGQNLSAYAICANPGDCVPGVNGQITVTVVGGTSASTPAMAGIMALVNQKYGRQGQANYTLYPLARQKPAAFHDIVLGGNNVPCVDNSEIQSPDCVHISNSNPGLAFSLSGYPATRGYDLASGLGSVDANLLVANWKLLTFAATTTSLRLAPSTLTHGSPATAAVTVDSSTAGETPQGGVSIVAHASQPTSRSVDLLTLDSSGSASGAIDSLPGGTYKVWASYGGDDLHAASHSPAISVTVTPEPSRIDISAWTTFSGTIPNPGTVCTPVVGQYEVSVPSGSSINLGELLWLSVQPAGSISGETTATGSVTFTFDGKASAVPLNVSGIATWITPPLSAGRHTVTASYSGDASYGASASPPFIVTVEKLQTELGMSPGGVWRTGTTYDLYAGDSYIVPVYLHGGCVLPTGNVTVTLGRQTQTVTLLPDGFPPGEDLWGIATFPNVQAGTYALSATYSGDGNYSAVSDAGIFTVVVEPSASARISTSTIVTDSNSVLTYNEGSAVFSVTVTGAKGSKASPTGAVYVYANGEGITSIDLTASGAGTATGTSIPVGAYGEVFNLDLNRITAVYTGDRTYRESVSAPIPLTVVTPAVTPDFTFAAQLSQIAVQPGSSSAVGVNIAPSFGFSGAVALSCATSSVLIGCSVNPGSVMVNGQATATLTIHAATQKTALAPFATSVVVTGAANGIVHNSKITVLVP